MSTHLVDDVIVSGDDNRKMENQSDLALGKHVQRARDIFLCHNGANKPWVESLAEQLETVRYKDRYLGVVFDKWDFQKGKNIVLELEAGPQRPCGRPARLGISMNRMFGP